AAAATSLPLGPLRLELAAPEVLSLGYDAAGGQWDFDLRLAASLMHGDAALATPPLAIHARPSGLRLPAITASWESGRGGTAAGFSVQPLAIRMKATELAWPDAGTLP